MRAILLALLLAGCATAAQREVEDIRRQNLSARDAMLECRKPIRSDPRYAIVYDNLAIANPDSPTLAQLLNSKHPTATEKQTVMEWHSAGEPCRNIPATQAAPNLRSVIVDSQNRATMILYALVNEGITWGEANKRIRDNSNLLRAELQQADRAQANRLQAAHSAEMQNRANIAAAFAAASQAAAAQAAANRPVNTNCTRFGNTVNCQTY